MRTDLCLNSWEISHTSSVWKDEFSESIFFTGNGRMGIRGYLPFEDDLRGVQKGLYLAGIFGEIKPGITDLVNLPTPVLEQLFINNDKAVLCSPIHRHLNMKNCTLTVSFSMAAEFDGSSCADITCERFFPFDSPSLFVQRTIISSKKNISIKLLSGLSTASCNSPVPDDQTKSNSEIIYLANLSSLTTDNTSFTADFDITGTGLKVSETIYYRIHEASPKYSFSEVKHNNDSISRTFTTCITPEKSFTIDKIANITTSRDVDPRIEAFTGAQSYESLFTRNTDAWSSIWSKCDFLLPEISNKYQTDYLPDDGDPELLCALRFNMLNLITSCSRCDSTVSIGARGLTHGRYKGCYFWDTDVFMLPFFLKNDITAAKSLLEYRVNMLPAAKLNSQKMNTRGARYPWMSSLDGSEQCESWDIGCSEIHITADIVYAMEQYHKCSNDDDFYLNKAAEVYIETARFWASRYTWNRNHTHADLLFCKGPDEYCGITKNNLFTNIMVKHNLRLAIKAAQDLAEKCPEIYHKLDISDEELLDFNRLHDAIVIPHDPDTGHLTTDETFHLLEPVELSTLKADDSASYHSVCFDRLQRYKVVKQADVLLIMTRLPELFSDTEKKEAWFDFEPLCLHDSTLSFASHALFALQNGFYEKGYAYLKKALLLDLRDVMGNTGHEGLHLASMGEAWQAACFCK